MSEAGHPAILSNLTAAGDPALMCRVLRSSPLAS
jgi:hypothetical protein